MLQMGVSVNANSANEALRTAADRATALITSLRTAGVGDDDIQTSNVSLYPRYDDKGQQVTGYQASNDLMIRIRSLAAVGDVIDAAANEVGNEITLGGISFSVSDDAAAVADARVHAIADARLRAGQYAAAVDATVGDVQAISEVAIGSPQPMQFSAKLAMDRASTPIQAGTQDLNVNVTVVFELT